MGKPGLSLQIFLSSGEDVTSPPLIGTMRIFAKGSFREVLLLSWINLQSLRLGEKKKKKKTLCNKPLGDDGSFFSPREMTATHI